MHHYACQCCCRNVLRRLQKTPEVRSALPCLKQRLVPPRDCAIALCTMTDADTILDGIVGASVVAAFFSIAMLDTHSVWLDVVGALWICALSLFAMHITILITMSNGFPFALFMHNQFIHDAGLYFEDVSCECAQRMWVVVWWVQKSLHNNDVCS